MTDTDINDSFPERCHHPKEDEFLFRLPRKLKSRAGD
jgi:hemerythrin-like domain-containing protein